MQKGVARYLTPEMGASFAVGSAPLAIMQLLWCACCRCCARPKAQSSTGAPLLFSQDGFARRDVTWMDRTPRGRTALYELWTPSQFTVTRATAHGVAVEPRLRVGAQFATALSKPNGRPEKTSPVRRSISVEVVV